jgi:hypothetical protein
MGKNNEKAVSETIGFILLLSIVITGIGLVTLYGYPILLEQQQNANIKNMEKNMIVLQNDVKLLAYKGVPYRETSMQIGGGTLQVIRPNPPPFSTLPGGRSNFIITVGGVPYPPYYTGLLQFNSTSDIAIIGLQNGAVVTNGFSQEGSTMLSEPRWFLDTNQTGGRTLVISIVNITSSNTISTSSGIRTVQMNISSQDPVDQQLAHLTPVYVQYSDSGEGYTTAWRNYFKNQQVFPDCSVDDASINLTVPNVARLVIKTYTVTVLNL